MHIQIHYPILKYSVKTSALAEVITVPLSDNFHAYANKKDSIVKEETHLRSVKGSEPEWASQVACGELLGSSNYSSMAAHS